METIILNQPNLVETTWSIAWQFLKDPRIWVIAILTSFFNGIGTGLGAGFLVGVLGKKLIPLIKRFIKIEEERK